MPHRTSIYRRLWSIVLQAPLVTFIYLSSVILLVWLSSEAWEKESLGLDKGILLWIHQGANPLLDRLMLLVTGLGDPGWAIGIVVGVLVWTVGRRHYQDAGLFLVTCLGGLVLNIGLKQIFAKTRPELWPRLISEHSYSFPSGHAIGAVVLYGGLAYLFAQRWPRQTIWIYSVTTILISAIGFSRLYLGVHWPTDIIAGYLVGGLWLFGCIQIAQKYSRKFQ